MAKSYLPLQQYKMFGGRRYRLAHWYKTKTEAKSHAERTRKDGRLARVVRWDTKSPFKWLVYTAYKGE